MRVASTCNSPSANGGTSATVTVKRKLLVPSTCPSPIAIPSPSAEREIVMLLNRSMSAANPCPLMVVINTCPAVLVVRTSSSELP